MAITLRRQLTHDEKEIVLQQHGRECFATGHTIPDSETMHFDHIRALATGGQTDINNIAPMCSQHNREKGTLPLFDFRTKLKLDSFFSSGDRLTLGHLLDYLRSEGMISNYGLSISVSKNGDVVRVISSTVSQECKIYKCPITRWDYFYATLPIDILDSDDDQDQTIGLQPRYLISDKVFQLFRHFQTRPVLQPSLGRIVGDRIKLFDGQHKAAALLWNGHRNLECKVYLEPDLRRLNQTNIDAHEKFAQTRFYSSIMVMKLGAQFGADFESYKNQDDDQVKSEAGFFDHLRIKDNLTKGEVSKRFRSFLYNSVLEDGSNRFARLVSTVNRPTDEKPISINSLEKSLFASLLYRVPTEDNMTTDAYKRSAELRNMVWLMNLLDELALQRWNPKATSHDELQHKLERLIRARFMKAWAEILRDAILARLEIFDVDVRAKPLYGEFTQDEFASIEHIVTRLVDWKIWSAPANSDVDQIQMDNDKTVKDWVRQKGLTVGYLLGAPE